MNIDFEKATAAELKMFRRSLNLDEMDENQKSALADLDDLILERLAEEKVNGVMKKRQSKDLQRKYDDRAYRMFPELKDKESDLYAAVDKYLSEIDPGSSNPMALLTAAQMAADDLDIAPASERRAGGDPKITKLAPGSPEDGGEEKDGEFLKRTESKVGQAFAHLIDLKDEKVRSRLEAEYEKVREENH